MDIVQIVQDVLSERGSGTVDPDPEAKGKSGAEISKSSTMVMENRCYKEQKKIPLSILYQEMSMRMIIMMMMMVSQLYPPHRHAL